MKKKQICDTIKFVSEDITTGGCYASKTVNITSIDSVKGVENQTLIRGEAGISIVGNNGFNGFATIGHSFGCDYKSTDFNLGVGYSW